MNTFENLPRSAPQTFHDLEINIKLDLAEMNNKKLEEARKGVANLAVLAYNYAVLPEAKHRDGLLDVEKLAHDILMKIT